ncbi:MAG: UDP-galactopyranose mutase [Victivallaceae bacterium]|nr:UDP-galactopyranose mutase [Victivallaceae bacterium]
MKNIIIVGAGFFGAVIAERIANDLNLPVTIIDKRKHIGGNSWSETDSETGIEIHKYGSHIFHTSNEDVWKYICRFAAWNEYRHKVLTTCNGEVYTMPVNLGTINQYYHRAMAPETAKNFILAEIRKENITDPQNLEEKAVSMLGRPLYQAFFHGYTKKQWEKDPKELSPEIITRLPVRFNYNYRYFSDKYEGIPLNGYETVFRKMLCHKNIDLKLNTDFKEYKKCLESESLIIYTGAIDEYFNYRLGRLEWRTLDFKLEKHPYHDIQGTAVMNYADEEIPFTRIHEFKHYHPERKDKLKETIIFKEYSRFASIGDDPYYPVLTLNNVLLLKAYQQLASGKKNIIFGGRLGSYKYLDMDDTIAEALSCYKKRICPLVNP